jgi:hypothetical protein
LAVWAVLASLLVASPAAAQSNQASDQGSGLGVKGGYLVTSFETDTNPGLFSSEGGWILGAFFGGNRPGRLGLQWEVNFLRKSQLCGCNQQQVDLYYMQIPALLRVNLGERSANRMAFYAVAGPAVELKIGEELRSLIIREYSSVDASIIVGGGVEVARFVIELRGSWGLMNLVANPAPGVKVKARTFAILGGFRIN